MTSLVIMIFLTHPSDNSSSVQLSFFSTAGGFRRAVDCENMIGVGDLRLTSFNREASVSDELLLLLVLFDWEPSASDKIGVLVSEGKKGKGISVSELLLLLIRLDSVVVLCRHELFVQERGLAGVGVLLLLLPFLVKKEPGNGISVSELLLLPRSLDSGVVLRRLALCGREPGLGVLPLLALLDVKDAQRVK